jgi:hypothetical protein
MDSHQKQQLDAFGMLETHLRQITPPAAARLKDRLGDYLAFRSDTAAFLQSHFNAVCTRACYESQMSACCQRDGIIVYFADVAVNMLVASAAQMAAIIERLAQPHRGAKCLYLSERGCLWTVKPIVCEMFLCDPARDRVFGENPDLHRQWEALEWRRKGFTWPDRPVLFDRIEAYFLEAGLDSPLMYFHKSPGLLRVKRHAERP